MALGGVRVFGLPQPSVAPSAAFWFLLRTYGDALDLDEGILGKGGDLDGGAGRRYDAFGGEETGVEDVHGGEVGHVLEEDGGFDDVGDVQVSSGEDGSEVFKDAGGLGGDSARDELAAGRIKCDLAGGVEDSTRADGLRVGADGRWRGVGGDGEIAGRSERHTLDCAPSTRSAGP